MVKQYERIQSLVCIACENCECDKCNIEDISQRIVNDIRTEAIDECIDIVLDLPSKFIDYFDYVPLALLHKQLEQLKEQK